MNTTAEDNRFEVFFAEDTYRLLKNDLYNYIIRKRAVEAEVKREQSGITMEVGSGISPMITCNTRVVYTDLSLSAMRTLKNHQGSGWYVVADSTRLPFKTRSFSNVICSEVLEHIEDDDAVIHEMARVMALSGQLVVTFPHRRFYFAIDDRLVHHHRRYELWEMMRKMQTCGFIPLKVRKVLGPLEKLTMVIVAFSYLCIKNIGGAPDRAPDAKRYSGGWFLKVITPLFKWSNRAYAAAVRLDARVMPQALSAVLLMKCMLDKSKVKDLKTEK